MDNTETTLSHEEVNDSDDPNSLDHETNSDIDTDDERNIDIISFVFVTEVLFPFHLNPKRPMYDSILQGQDWLGELIRGHPNRIVNSLRMHKESFEALCKLVIQHGLFKTCHATKVSVHESISIFLTTVGFASRQHTTCEHFQHSLETISCHVNRVAKAICKLSKELIKPPNMSACPRRILNDPLLYPYFKDCVGAIDGTLISAWAPVDKHNTFCSRKGELGQNVLAACDFDLVFTYILVGWDGSANDAHVLTDALRRDGHFPWPPEGKYYMVDSGFCNFPGFLAPYRQHRYHINTWCGAMFDPKGPEELFNKRHSRLQNAIERAFGVLKDRFPILKGPMSQYYIRRQVNIVIACFVLHNWLRENYHDDWYFRRAEQGQYDPDEAADDAHQIPHQSQQDLDAQSQFRDALAATMWANRR